MVDDVPNPEDVQVRSFEEAELHERSDKVRLEALEKDVSNMKQKFNTLESPLWKRIWFRIDGWPGQRDLNADHRAWRPWH